MKSFTDWQKTIISLLRSSPAWLKVPRFNSAAAKAISVLIFACLATPSRALIFYSTGDTNYNTTAPTADPNSGWDLQGYWSLNLGTPIGPHHFITANHVGGAVGDQFFFRGVLYTTISTTVDSVSDLRIWEVAGTFPAWAELYNGTTETGLDLMVYGRGSSRGADVTVNGALKGWQWGTYDGRLRWGRNKVTAITSTPAYPSSDVLQIAFNTNGTADEAHLAYGDSGGAVFIKDTTWKLAAINFEVDGPYNTGVTGAGFNAAIFDEGGLYKKSGGLWVLVPDRTTTQAGNFYATRIKSRITWIQSVLSAPLTPWPVTLVQSSNANGNFTAVNNATWDSNGKTFRLPIPTGQTFFQIQGSASVTITGTSLQNGMLVVSYQ